MMQIATSLDNQPWCCTVYYAVNENYDLIWLSMPSRKHSEDIKINPKVAGVIAYDQQPPQPYVRGVQFSGDAELLEGDEAVEAVKLYAEQLNSSPKWVESVIAGTDPHRAYRIRVSKFTLFDSQNFPDESRQQWIPGE
jgi:uncharacterized protein YhbP (UPF0306 family)